MDLINTEAVSTLWPRMVDPKNNFVMFNKLELAGSKAELRRRVGQ